MAARGLVPAVEAARAIGHPARARILAMLRGGELCVCHLTSILGLAPSTVSAHLRELRQAGLIDQTKRGRWIHVSLPRLPGTLDWVERFLASTENDPQTKRDARRAEALRRRELATCAPDSPAAAGSPR